MSWNLCYIGRIVGYSVADIISALCLYFCDFFDCSATVSSAIEWLLAECGQNGIVMLQIMKFGSRISN